MKKLISALLVTAAATVPFTALADYDSEIGDYLWAQQSVGYCFENGILSGNEYGELNLGGNLTRAEMARIFTDTFGLSAARTSAFDDLDGGEWYYGYALALQDYMPKREEDFNGYEYVTREEFAATLVSVSGGSPAASTTITKFNFEDADEVDEEYKYLVETAVIELYLHGDNDRIYPKDLLTRAEACAFVYRLIDPAADKTPITGDAEVSLEQAKRWARSKNAQDIYIGAADLYWYYGEQFGIRPEVMYAQAARETGYGRYGGAITPEMNNWAGIKIKNPSEEKLTENFESFATPDDGVRGHFNHMSAYVGIAPIGEVHGRYSVVMSIDWAGTVKYIEQLGGRWCPEIEYGYQIADMVEDMKRY